MCYLCRKLLHKNNELCFYVLRYWEKKQTDRCKQVDIELSFSNINNFSPSSPTPLEKKLHNGSLAVEFVYKNLFLSCLESKIRKCILWTVCKDSLNYVFLTFLMKYFIRYFSQYIFRSRYWYTEGLDFNSMQHIVFITFIGRSSRS